MRGERAAAGGFTLLEIAVALAVLGVGVVTCLQVFGASLRLQSRSARESQVVMHARATMDALFFGGEIVDHTEERTTAEGFKTRIVVRPAGPEEGVTDQDLRFQSDISLHYLEVDVAWQDGAGVKTYVLKSMRVAQESSQ
jgi:prepilin-type N-terminal cleavage/methylation domain-containing protein